MTTANDASHGDHTYSDIAKTKKNPDGSSGRRPSTFRDTIEKGGVHEPEKGTTKFVLLSIDSDSGGPFFQVVIISTSHMAVVSIQRYI